jgi:hypothetical protein
MLTTDPAAPEFAPIRAELARLFIAKKADLGMSSRDDAEIAARVDDVAFYLVSRIGAARALSDSRFLDRFAWLFERHITGVSKERCYVCSGTSLDPFGHRTSIKGGILSSVLLTTKT